MNDAKVISRATDRVVFEQKGEIFKRLAADADIFSVALHEVVLGHKLKHKNILTCNKVWYELDNGKVSFVMRFPKKTPFPEVKWSSLDQIKQAYRDVLNGVEALHKRKLVHGDLKPNNMVLDEAPSLKVSNRLKQDASKEDASTPDLNKPPSKIGNPDKLGSPNNLGSPSKLGNPSNTRDSTQDSTQDESKAVILHPAKDKSKSLLLDKFRKPIPRASRLLQMLRSERLGSTDKPIGVGRLIDFGHVMSINADIHTHHGTRGFYRDTDRHMFYGLANHDLYAFLNSIRATTYEFSATLNKVSFVRSSLRFYDSEALPRVLLVKDHLSSDKFPAPTAPEVKQFLASVETLALLAARGANIQCHHVRKLLENPLDSDSSENESSGSNHDLDRWAKLAADSHGLNLRDEFEGFVDKARQDPEYSKMIDASLNVACQNSDGERICLRNELHQLRSRYNNKTESLKLLLIFWQWFAQEDITPLVQYMRGEEPADWSKFVDKFTPILPMIIDSGYILMAEDKIDRIKKMAQGQSDYLRGIDSLDKVKGGINKMLLYTGIVSFLYERTLERHSVDPE